jgi:hypothetical protein
MPCSINTIHGLIECGRKVYWPYQCSSMKYVTSELNCLTKYYNAITTKEIVLSKTQLCNSQRYASFNSLQRQVANVSSSNIKLLIGGDIPASGEVNIVKAPS